MYFKDFPKFLYDFKYGTTSETKTSVVRDITRNIRFRKEVLENYSLYDEYDIKDGETPEIIAEKIYGNPEYHWIIMLANQRYDYLNDFPMEYVTLVKHAAIVYNPTLYSSAGDWYFTGTGTNRKLYFKVANPEDAFNPLYLTSSVVFTVKGATSTGSFTVTGSLGITGSITTPPGTIGYALPGNVYGASAATILGDPSAWLSIQVDGATYKLPLYN